MILLSNKVISTILNLKDNMSGGLVKVSDKVKGLDKNAQKASKQIAIMANNFKKKVDAMASTAVKLSATGAVIAGAFSLKTGLAEAMDLEGFRTQLETATKDTQRAGEVMKYAIDLANRTPFEGGELVSAASSLEMFGLRTERWLPILGDAAAGVNRSMEDVQSGFIKAATTGDFASLRDTLSITKEMVEEYAKLNFGKSFTNSKGQVEDTELLQNSLEGLINNRYGGGMNKLSKTTKGMWSTITGVTKNSLSRIVGMQNDGTVKVGSLLDRIKTKIGGLADRLMEWQNDGTIDKIANTATIAFGNIYNVAEQLFVFFIRHKDTIAIAIGAIAGLTIGTKAIIGIKKALDGLKVMWGIFNGVLKLTPVGKVITLITILAGVLVLAYQKSEKFRNLINNLWKNLKEFSAMLTNAVIAKLQELGQWFSEKILPKLKEFGKWFSNEIMPRLLAFQKVIEDKVVNCLKTLQQWISNKIVPTIKELGQWFSEKILPKLEVLKSSFSNFLEKVLKPVDGFISDSLISTFANLYETVLKPISEFMMMVFGAAFVGAFYFISNGISTIIGTIKGIIGNLLDVLVGIIDFLTGVFTGDWELAWKGVTSIFTGIIGGIKSIFSGTFNFIIDGINSLTSGVNDFTKNLSSVPGFKWAEKINIPRIPNFALGTQYFSGGLAQINEKGGEIVNLPSGSQVIPTDKTEKIINNYQKNDDPVTNKDTKNITITININITGQEKSIKNITDEVIEQMIPELKLALANTV